MKKKQEGPSKAALLSTYRNLKIQLRLDQQMLDSDDLYPIKDILRKQMSETEDELEQVKNQLRKMGVPPAEWDRPAKYSV